MSKTFAVGDFVDFDDNHSHRAYGTSGPYKVIRVVDNPFMDSDTYAPYVKQHLFFESDNAPAHNVGPWSNEFYHFVKREPKKTQEGGLPYGEFYVNKFAIGDKVVWRNDYWATLLKGSKNYGEGPFEVVDTYTHLNDMSRRSAGHIQGVTVMIDGKKHVMSGAFFVKDNSLKESDVMDYQYKTVKDFFGMPKVFTVTKDAAPNAEAFAGLQSKKDKQATVIRGMQGKIDRQRKEINDLQLLREVEADLTEEFYEKLLDYSDRLAQLNELVTDLVLQIRDLNYEVLNLDEETEMLRDEY
jgi:hypothetical protein